MVRLSIPVMDSGITVKVKKLTDSAVIPTRAHPSDAGFDLYAINDMELISLRLLGTETCVGKHGYTHPPVEPQAFLVHTGIALEIPEGYYGKIEDRSSLAVKGIKTAGGVIDSSYRGELKVVLYNHTSQSVKIKRGARIAQLLILPLPSTQVVEATELQETRRGDGGFGSSGV